MSAIALVLQSKPADAGAQICDATLQPEDPREYAQLLAGYIAEYRPQGVLEQELVRQLASATHRLRRIDRVENAAMLAESIAHTSDDAGAIAMERFTEIAALCAKLGRARTQAERAFQRAYKDLEARRAHRLSKSTPAEAIEIESTVRFKPIVQNKASFEPAGPPSHIHAAVPNRSQEKIDSCRNTRAAS